MSIMIYDKENKTFIANYDNQPAPRVGENISIYKLNSLKPIKYFVSEVVHCINVNEVTVEVYVEKDVKAAKTHYMIDKKRIDRIAHVVKTAKYVQQFLLEDELCTSYRKDLAKALNKLTDEDKSLLGLSDD